MLAQLAARLVANEKVAGSSPAHCTIVYTTKMTTKRCPRCKKTKPIEEFHLKYRASESTKRGTYCKPCQNAYAREHYEANKQTYVDKAARHNARYHRENTDWLMTYLLDHPCKDCGEADPIVLEFDHRDPRTKECNVSSMLTGSLAHLQSEIAKCDVVCANCHSRRTAKMFGNWKLDHAHVA